MLVMPPSKLRNLGINTAPNTHGFIRGIAESEP